MEQLSRRDWLGTTALTAAAAALAGVTQAQAQAQTQAPIDALLGAARSARLFDLSFVWNEQSPLLSLNPPYALALNRTHAMTHELFGQAPGSQISWASEMMYFSGQHGAPTIDAIGHIGRNLKLFGGVDAKTATATPGGIGAGLGIESFPTNLMLSRAVFLDVARHVNGGSADPLSAAFEVKAEHLEETAKAQGVEVRRGDTLLIRTGLGQSFGTNNVKYLGTVSPGPGPDAAQWIIDRGVRLAAADTATFERRPALKDRELFPVHMMLIADNGIYIVENINLEPLSEAKAYVVLLIVTPLRIQGASGSPLRAIALAP